MTQDEGHARGSAQLALALVAILGESMGGSVPNSAEAKVGRWKRRGFDRKKNELSE